MSDFYHTYICRNGEDIEVSAQLYSHGKVEEGYDRWNGGYWAEVIDDPVFTDFVAFDDYDVELTLTPREILDSEVSMVRQYWDRYEAEWWGYGAG